MKTNERYSVHEIVQTVVVMAMVMIYAMLVCVDAMTSVNAPLFLQALLIIFLVAFFFVGTCAWIATLPTKSRSLDA